MRGLRLARQIALFSGCLLVCTVINTTIWESCVANHLYHCTDSVGFDYLGGPPHWVHGTVAGQTGNYGDTIAPGWSFQELILLWLTMIGASFVVSILVAWRPWRAQRPFDGRRGFPIEPRSPLAADAGTGSTCAGTMGCSSLEDRRDVYHSRPAPR
jgi:hypothetical protein